MFKRPWANPASLSELLQEQPYQSREPPASLRSEALLALRLVPPR
jgi:hypothetical protein